MRALPPFPVPRWFAFPLALCGCDFGYVNCVVWPLWWAVVVWAVSPRHKEGGR